VALVLFAIEYERRMLFQSNRGAWKVRSEIETAHVLLFNLVRKKRLAMLDLLIAASRENHITDLDIREEVDTFMFEVGLPPVLVWDFWPCDITLHIIWLQGHDTTAMAICFFLLLLAEHKDIQVLADWRVSSIKVVYYSRSKREILWNFLHEWCGKK